jgi:hypothetical protein
MKVLRWGQTVHTASCELTVAKIAHPPCTLARSLKGTRNQCAASLRIWETRSIQAGAAAGTAATAARAKEKHAGAIGPEAPSAPVVAPPTLPAALQQQPRQEQRRQQQQQQLALSEPP